MTLCVDNNFNGRSIHVPVGETVEISLAETRTTGFRWTIFRSGEPACQPVGEWEGKVTGTWLSGEVAKPRPGNWKLLVDRSIVV